MMNRIKPGDVQWHLSDGVYRVSDDSNFGRLIADKKKLILSLNASDIKTHTWMEGGIAFCLSVVDTAHLSIPVVVSNEPLICCFVRFGITMDGETRFLVPSYTGRQHFFIDKKGKDVGKAPQSICVQSLRALYDKRTVQYTVSAWPGFKFTMVKKSEQTDKTLRFDLPEKGTIFVEVSAFDPKGHKLFVYVK